MRFPEGGAESTPPPPPIVIRVKILLGYWGMLLPKVHLGQRIVGGHFAPFGGFWPLFGQPFAFQRGQRPQMTKDLSPPTQIDNVSPTTC